MSRTKKNPTRTRSPKITRTPGPTADWLDDIVSGKYRWITVGGAIALAFLIFSPVLSGVFQGDDSQLSLYTARFFALDHSSLTQLVLSDLHLWIQGIGRFYPLSEYWRVLFYVVNGNTVAYKLFIVALTLVDLLLFRLLVLKLTKSHALGLLALVLPALLIQVRYADDPMTTIQGLLQLVTLLTLVSLIFFVMYLDTGKKGDLAASLAFYGASLLTYEIGVPFFVVFFLIAWFYPRRGSSREAVKRSWPFAALVGSDVLLVLAIRLIYRLPLSGSAGVAYAPSLDPFAAAATLVKQTASALPLTYNAAYALRDSIGFGWLPYAPPLPGFLGTVSGYPVAALVLGLGYGALVAAACVVAVREQLREKSRASVVSVGMLGACLLVLPGVLISLSPKYQQDRWIRWGVPYLPIIVSCFGLAALIAWGLYRALGGTRRSQAWVVVTAAATAAALFVAVSNYGNTASVVKGWASYYDYPRAIEESALHRGVMQPYPDGAPLLAKIMDWGVPAFFLVNADKKVGLLSPIEAPSTDVTSKATTSAATAKGRTYTFGPGNEVYGFDFKGLSREDGFAILLGFKSFTVASDGSLADMQAIPISVYLSWDPPGTAVAPGTVEYDSLTKAGLDPAQWVADKSGPNWALYRLRGLP